jgi:hypothetical protein
MKKLSRYIERGGSAVGQEMSAICHPRMLVFSRESSLQLTPGSAASAFILMTLRYSRRSVEFKHWQLRKAIEQSVCWE